MSRSVVVRAVAVLTVGAALGGCGRVAAEDRTRGDREPSIVVVTASVSADGVRLSPARVGAGPVRVVLTNQTDDPVRPALVRGRRTVPAGTVAPGGVTSFVGRLGRGRWTLRAGADAAPSARLVVATARPDGDQDLLQP